MPTPYIGTAYSVISVPSLNRNTTALYNAQNQIGKNVDKLGELDDEQGNVEDSGRNLNDVLGDMAGKLGVDLPEGFSELLGPLGNVSTEMLGLAGMVAGVGAKMVECAKETMEYVDEVNTLASVSGLSTDTLQKFMFMEDLVDVSTEKFVDTTKDLTRSVGDALDGNEELNETFKNLGVTLVDEQGNVRDMEEIYWDVIDALAGMESGIERDNTAMSLMGEGARDLNPLLDQTKEGIDEMTQAAEDCGYVMDENTLKNVQKLTDGLETLRRKITGSLRDAMGELANWLAGDLDASKMTTGLAPFLASYADTALSGLVTNAAVNCPFTVWTDIPRGSAISFNNLAPSSFRSNLAGREGSILDLYGGEYEFDNYAVKLHQHRGADNGVRIVYGKNLVDLNQEENIASAITGIYPYWTDGTTTVTLTEKVVQIQSTYAFPRVIALDMSHDFSEQPTEAELRAAATVYINRSGISSPTVSIRVSFVQLWQTAGYEDIAALEHVSLCDTVTVHMDKLGVDTSAKVIRTVYDTLNERYDSIDLGDPRASIAETIAHQQEAIGFVESNAITAGQVNGIVDAQTEWISGGDGGNVFFKRNAQGQPIELVWLDTNSLLTATNVFRINIDGLGFSSTGYAGPYTSAWTSDGKFSADFIKVGKLASANGKFNIDLSRNTITIKNSDNDTVFSFDANGNLEMSGRITANSGEIGGFDIGTTGLTSGNVSIFSGGITNQITLGDPPSDGVAFIEMNGGLTVSPSAGGVLFNADIACSGLDVSGEMLTDLPASSGGDTVYWGNSTRRFVYHSSARKYKNTIKTVEENEARKLLDLRPVTFFYNSDDKDMPQAMQYGVIADEAVKQYPTMVGCKDGEINSFHYDQLFAPMIKLLQLQEQRIAELEGKLGKDN